MRIVLITSKLRFEKNSSPIGGSVVDLHLKAKGLAELGHEITVVTAFSNENRIPCPVPYKVIERNIQGRGLLGIQRGVYTLLWEFESKADVFYFDGHMFLYGGGAYRLLGGKVPVVGFFNVRLNAWADASGNAERPPFLRRVKKRLRVWTERFFGAPIANRMDAFIFNTPQVQKLYHNFGIGRGKPNSVIEDFIATREIMKRFDITERGVAEHQRKSERITLLSTGRMLPEKGFELLVRALARVKDKTRYRVILSGGGPDKEWLEARAKELGLSDTIEFPGWVPKEQLYQFFKEAHVFVFPRWWIEYGSAVLTEAFAFGLPSIIPGSGALEWLAGGSALIFKNESVDELARQIETLGTNAELRVKLAERALERARKLDAQVLAKRLEAVVINATQVK